MTAEPRAVGFDGSSFVYAPEARAAPGIRRIRTWSLDNHALERESLRQGARTIRVNTETFLALCPGRDGDASIVFDMSIGDGVGAAALELTRHKGTTARLLQRAGVPIAEGEVFKADERGSAVAYGASLGYPLVVKPAAGSLGLGITTDIGSAGQLERALERAAASRFAPSGVRVERHVEGRDYRMFVLDGQVLSAVYRQPAQIIGDGVRSIEALVAARNARRQVNPYIAKRPAELNAGAVELLEAQGLSPGTVADPGTVVRLSPVANVSRGGDTHEVLDECHPGVLEAIGRVTSAIPGLPHAGVDVLMDDHRRPPDEQDMTVVEINSKAELGIHEYPAFGPSRNVAEELVGWYREREGLPSSVPRDELQLVCKLEGRVVDVGFESWTTRRAAALGCEARFRSDSEALRVELAGPNRPVTALVARLMDGPKAARVMTLATEPLGFNEGASERVPGPSS